MTLKSFPIYYYPFNKVPQYAVNKYNGSIYRIEKNPSKATVNALLGKPDSSRFEYVTLNKEDSNIPDVKEFVSLFDQWLLYPILNKGGDILKEDGNIYILTILESPTKSIETVFKKFIDDYFILFEKDIRRQELTYKWFPIEDNIVPDDYYQMVLSDLSGPGAGSMIIDCQKPLHNHHIVDKLIDPNVSTNIIYQRSLNDRNMNEIVKYIKRMSDLKYDTSAIFDLMELKLNNDIIDLSIISKLIGSTWDSDTITPVISKNKQLIVFFGRDINDSKSKDLFLVNNLNNTIIAETKSNSKFVVGIDITAESFSKMNMYLSDIWLAKKDCTSNQFRLTEKDENIDVRELFNRVSDLRGIGKIKWFAIPVRRK